MLDSHEYDNIDIYLAAVARRAQEADQKIIYTERGTPIPVDKNTVEKVLSRIKRAVF